MSSPTPGFFSRHRQNLYEHHVFNFQRLEANKYLTLFENLSAKSSILTIKVLQKLKKFLKLFDKEIDFSLKCLSQWKKIQETFQIYSIPKDLW